MTFNRGHSAAAKLTAQQVLEIRQHYNAGWTQGRLSREYRVSIGQIGRIVRGEAWQQYRQEVHPDEIEDSIARIKLMGLPIVNAADQQIDEFMQLAEPASEPRIDAVAEFMKLRSGRPPADGDAPPLETVNDSSTNSGQLPEGSKDENSQN